MPKDHFLTDAQLIVMGRRYGSDDTALEAIEVLARWRRDLPALATYGFGQAELDAFSADVAAHAKLRETRPEAVTGKKLSVVTRDKHVSAGWAWVDRVTSILGVLARRDQNLATALASATPRDDEALEAGIRTLRNILGESKTRLPDEAQVDKRLAEVEALCASLVEAPGSVHTSKGQTVAETAQIDLLDGKLYAVMRDLNSAGRKAIRNGDLQAGLHEYALHHLKRSGNPNPSPTPTTGPGTPAAATSAS
jgi:hypothetical protein